MVTAQFIRTLGLLLISETSACTHHGVRYCFGVIYMLHLRVKIRHQIDIFSVLKCQLYVTHLHLRDENRVDYSP